VKRILTAALRLLAFIVRVSSAESKPNILFIVCDDLNTHVSSSGYDGIQTPTFAALAKEGMTFSRAFCQYPVIEASGGKQ
jgi:iduronate 2-sulfatase